jgi:hypothetical protein
MTKMDGWISVDYHGRKHTAGTTDIMCDTLNLLDLILYLGTIHAGRY